MSAHSSRNVSSPPGVPTALCTHHPTRSTGYADPSEVGAEGHVAVLVAAPQTKPLAQDSPTHPNFLMVMVGVHAGEPRHHEGQLPANLESASRRNLVKPRQSITKSSCVIAAAGTGLRTTCWCNSPRGDLKGLRPQIFNDKQVWLSR